MLEDLELELAEGELKIFDDYVGEVRDLSAAIRGEQKPRYAWEPLDATMRVLDACFASDKSGRAERV